MAFGCALCWIAPGGTCPFGQDCQRRSPLARTVPGPRSRVVTRTLSVTIGGGATTVNRRRRRLLVAHQHVGRAKARDDRDNEDQQTGQISWARTVRALFGRSVKLTSERSTYGLTKPDKSYHFGPRAAPSRERGGTPHAGIRIDDQPGDRQRDCRRARPNARRAAAPPNCSEGRRAEWACRASPGISNVSTPPRNVE